MTDEEPKPEAMDNRSIWLNLALTAIFLSAVLVALAVAWVLAGTDNLSDLAERTEIASGIGLVLATATTVTFVLWRGLASAAGKHRDPTPWHHDGHL